MNRMIVKPISILFACYFFTLISANRVEANHNLSVGWELWYPYQYHNTEQQLVGLDFDIFNAIVKESQLNVNYTELPWKRHLHYIKTGEMDIAMGASYTEERAEYAFFTVPYRLELVKLYVRKGNIEKIDLPTLSVLSSSDYMIGVEGGYYYGSEYQELIKTAEFQSHINEVIDLEENVELLLAGHLDGFLVDPVTMKAFVDKYKLHGEFEQHPMTIYQDNIHIMLSKKTMEQTTVDKINLAIAKLESSGKLKQIIGRWASIQ